MPVLPRRTITIPKPRTNPTIPKRNPKPKRINPLKPGPGVTPKPKA